MKDFLFSAILYPFLAILFCLVFGVPFVYTGFQTIHVEGAKNEAGETTIYFTRTHFWGLVNIERRVDKVEGASFETSRIRRATSINNTRKTVSGVFIDTAEGSVPLFAGSSNLDENLKWEAVQTINEFIATPDHWAYTRTFRIRNIFGWVGLPFLVIGVLGLVGWPGSILKHWKQRS